MSCLSDLRIRKEIQEGNIVFFDPNNKDVLKNIGNCSVDVTLGQYYFRNKTPIKVFNPYSSEHVHSYWGKYQVADIISTEEDAKFYQLKISDKFILLQPLESILAHTNEFIGAKRNFTTMMKSRSSLGRSNVTICRDAGWGDVGYFNRWTLEITNNSSSPIVLKVGERIGQVIFFDVGEVARTYTGKYQGSEQLEELVNSWHPNNLLPKLYTE